MPTAASWGARERGGCGISHVEKGTNEWFIDLVLELEGWP